MSFWFLPNRYLLCTFPDHKCESLGVVNVNMRGLVPLVGVLLSVMSGLEHLLYISLIAIRERERERAPRLQKIYRLKKIYRIQNT